MDGRREREKEKEKKRDVLDGKTKIAACAIERK